MACEQRSSPRDRARHRWGWRSPRTLESMSTYTSTSAVHRSWRSARPCRVACRRLRSARAGPRRPSFMLRSSRPIRARRRCWSARPTGHQSFATPAPHKPSTRSGCSAPPFGGFTIPVCPTRPWRARGGRSPPGRSSRPRVPVPGRCTSTCRFAIRSSETPGRCPRPATPTTRGSRPTRPESPFHPVCSPSPRSLAG